MIHLRMKITMATAAVFFAVTFAFAQEDRQNDKLFERATKYFFQSNFDMAEALLQQVVQNDPGNARAHSYLGDIYLTRRKFDDALSHYTKSIAISPSEGDNYFRIGQIYYYRKNGPRAIEYFEKALQHQPSLVISHYHKGLTYLMIFRDKENTIRNWEAFLKAAPDDPQYDKIARAIALLKDPSFILPPPGSDISIEEALYLGGNISNIDRKTKDEKEGHENKETKKKIEDIYIDDDM